MITQYQNLSEKEDFTVEIFSPWSYNEKTWRSISNEYADAVITFGMSTTHSFSFVYVLHLDHSHCLILVVQSQPVC